MYRINCEMDKEQLRHFQLQLPHTHQFGVINWQKIRNTLAEFGTDVQFHIELLIPADDFDLFCEFAAEHHIIYIAG